jgi:hypothetical protein
MSCNYSSLPILFLPQNGSSPIIKGDTLKSISFEILTGPTGVETPIDLTGASIRVDLIHTKTSNNHYLLTSIDGDITITDAPNGLFKINSINRLDWKVGVYKGDLEITYVDTTRTTYCIIELTVTDDITK